MIVNMANARELKIDSSLAPAMIDVLGYEPQTAEAVVVLAAYLHSLKEGYGLSEHYELGESHFGHVAPPAAAAALIAQYLDVAEDQLDRETIGDRLYSICVALTEDPQSLRLLNKKAPLSEEGLLKVAQVSWNLEQRDTTRPSLPIASNQPLSMNGAGARAHIKVPGANKDFAIMEWTERLNQGVTGLGIGQAAKSSGQGFRTKAARVCVLAAKLLVDRHPNITATFSPATLTTLDTGRVISWPRDDNNAEPTPVVRADDNAAVPQTSTPAAPETVARILVGDFSEVGERYQPREFDALIDELWNDGGDRRVWLCGGPGLGKSYAARKVMQDALQDRSADREQVLIWVDSANAETVIRELARAADLIPALARPSAEDQGSRDGIRAREFLRFLATTDIPWLVVLDNAEPDEVITEKLIPSGVNQNGRVLITTTSRSTHIAGSGRQVTADLFSTDEATEFLANRLPNESDEHRKTLVEATGHHPLALSIASSTIAANSMDIEEWLLEFNANNLDVVADHPDSGGYPQLISATWRVALENASRGMPNGVIERAAIVAALQNPNGHPTWLWQREAVLDWVHSGNGPAHPSGKMPTAVKRLLDHSVLALTGNSWTQSKVSIHQMAARSIREIANPELLAEIAAILTDQWLLQLTGNPALAKPEEVAAALQPISKLGCISKDTRCAATALLGWALPEGNKFSLAIERETFRILEPHLMNGGATGQAAAASIITRIGIEERELDLKVAAQTTFRAAADIYGRLIHDAGIDDELLAECLQGLSDLDEWLGLTEAANEHRRQALRVLEQLKSSGPGSGGDFWKTLSVFDLNRQLHNDDASHAALDQAAAILRASVEASSDTRIDRLRELGGRLIEVGRLDEAFRSLSDAAALIESSSWRDSRLVTQAIDRQLASVHYLRKEWAQAEQLLTSSVGEPVVLASVQLHQKSTGDAGSEGRARDTLRKVAKRLRREPEGSTDEMHGTVEDSIGELDPEFMEDIKKMAGWRLTATRVKAVRHERWEDIADLSLGCLILDQERAYSDPGEHQRTLANSYEMAALSARVAGRKSATELSEKAVSIFEILSALDPSDAAAESDLVDALIAQGLVGVRFGDLEAAEQAARRAERLIQNLGSGDAAAKMHGVLVVLAACSEESGDLPSAIAHTQRQVELRRAASRGDSPSRAAREELADALENLSMIHAKAEEWPSVAQAATERSRILQVLHEEYPEDHDLQKELAEALRFACGVQYQICRTETAPEGGFRDLVETAQRAVAAWEDMAAKDPSEPSIQVHLALLLYILADAMKQTDQPLASVDAMLRAANYLQLPAELDPASHKGMHVSLLRELETALRNVGRNVEAEEIASRADEFDVQFPNEQPTSDE